MALLEHTGRRAVRVEGGELVAILGAPGSGKTRLGLELAFLTQPEEGEVLLRGENPMQGKRPAARPADVTMLVQNAEDQLFARTVADDVAFGPRHLRLPEIEVQLRVAHALEAVGLHPRTVRDRSPFALSGGERRRVALAGTIAMEPEVLILDEPTSSLDPRTRDEFVDLLRPLRRHTAVIWLTTSATEATLADRAYLLHDGATTETPRGLELLSEWRELDRAGVELPPVYSLASALERRGYRLPGRAAPNEMQEAIIHAWRDARRAG